MLGSNSTRMRAGGNRLFALIAILQLLALSDIVAAQEQHFPELTGRIVDEAGLLDPEVEASLDAQLAAHENQTSNQVVVVTLPSLHGSDIAD